MNLGFNTCIANGYKSETQRIRVLTENWVASQIYCPICGHEILSHYVANRPVRDFFCAKCSADFELKSKQSISGNLGAKITDGAYETMISRISSFENPNFLFLTYNNYCVNNLILIPNHFFTPDLIEKRNPLAVTARRAGWVGCNICINKIPESGKIFVVKNSIEVNRQSVVDKYQRAKKLLVDNIESRSWIIDVLNCVEQINLDSFSLNQVYAFTDVLQQKHPQNFHVKDKIRQQLQLLRDRGFLEFNGRGYYKKIK